MDTAVASNAAALWGMAAPPKASGTWPAVQCSASGTLDSVNADAETADLELAKAVRAGAIDALIAISSDPGGVNRHTCKAAAEMGIPVVGTGGTSMSALISGGCTVLGNSGGSVASNPESKAVVFTAALARHFGVRYRYCDWKLLELAPVHSILGGTLPVFIAAGLAQTALRSSYSALVLEQEAQDALLRASYTMPSLAVLVLALVTWGTCGALDTIAAAGVSAFLLAATATGTGTATHGSLVAALVGALATSRTLPHTLALVAQAGLPTTPSTIFAVTASIGVGALAVYYTTQPGQLPQTFEALHTTAGVIRAR